MAFHDPHSGAASTTFLILYTIFVCFAIFVVYRKGIKTSYTMILFFALLRVGAQLCAVAFSVVGYDGVNWLVAYLILGAEGYFTLILASMYFLIYAEMDQFGKSQFKPTKEQIKEVAQYDPRKARQMKLLSPAGLFHWVLIPANAFIISGGSMLTGVDPDKRDEYADKMHTAKILRGVGQAIFLVQNLLVGLLAVYLLFNRHVRQYKVVAVLLAWPFLFARGIFGLLSVFIDSLNYFDLSNYTKTGLSVKFIACEYVLGATMEFVGAAFILSSYYIKNDNKYKEPKSGSKLSVQSTDNVELQSKPEA